MKKVCKVGTMWDGKKCLKLQAQVVSLFPKADVLFLIDASKLVTKTQLEKIKIYLHNVLRQLPVSPDSIRIGIVLFAKKVKDLTWFNSFKDAKGYHSKIKKIGSLSDIGDLAGALKYARTKAFTLKHGSRKKAPHIIFVMSSGRINKQKKAVTEAKHAGSAGLRIFYVAVGPGPDSKSIVSITKAAKGHFLLATESRLLKHIYWIFKVIVHVTKGEKGQFRTVLI
jgi:uncharacterized protein YegL